MADHAAAIDLTDDMTFLASINNSVRDDELISTLRRRYCKIFTDQATQVNPALPNLATEISDVPAVLAAKSDADLVKRHAGWMAILEKVKKQYTKEFQAMNAVYDVLEGVCARADY